uniref:ATP-binding cassette sub-family D member 4 n=1 Tax=Phallusia mammillata TaxID=59560 RepID=A0A6F9D615_9ASCI|nr:ATP-binding cassette sub-family D member 4 [Phallusia mammillata]
MTNANLNYTFFRRLWRLFKLLFQKFNSRAAIIFYILFILSLLLQLVIYAAGLVPSRYFEVLGAKDSSGFKDLAIYSIALIVLNAVMKSMLQYVSRVLYLTWRKRLCTKIHSHYFVDMNFYKINVLDTSLDNIDQRITQDVDRFTREWSLLISKLVVTPFTIVYYSYQCFASTSWIGPVSIYIYFIVGTIINRLIMAPIVKLHVEQEVLEGNFRYQHLKVRTQCESMAFYHAGQTEHYKSETRLNQVLKKQMSLFNWSFWLSSSVNIFDYVGGILSYLVIAIPIFAGNYDHLAPEELSSLISRNAFVCIYLIYSFSQLIDMSSTIGDIAAHTHRLGQLLELIDCQTSEDSNDEQSTFDNFAFSDDPSDANLSSFHLKEFDKKSDNTEKSVDSQDNPHQEENKLFIKVENVTCSTPGHMSMLIKDLTFSISTGQNILITGGTGSGKTSLLRIIAGIWPAELGVVQKLVNFGPRGVMFLPQKAILTDGTLLDQMIYPRRTPYPEFSFKDNYDRINNIIEEVGLHELVDNNGGVSGKVELNWSDKLSVGEIQRLSFARLFYHHPNVAILDEATSGLSKATADQMFALCEQKQITCLTVAHGENLRKHHKKELHLHGNGEWTLKSLL